MCTYTEFVVAEPDCEYISHWVREEDCFLSPGEVGIGGEGGKPTVRAEELGERGRSKDLWEVGRGEFVCQDLALGVGSRVKIVMWTEAPLSWGLQHPL